MDIIEQMKKILSGENKAKIIGLAIVIILCFALVYTNSDPVYDVNSVDTNRQIDADILKSDFASVLSSVEGAGRVSVFITYKDDNSTSVQGVIIVAEGAKDLNVAIKLQTAAATAYGIGIDQIEVFQMKGAN